MAPPVRTRIVHYAWPEGLAIVVEGIVRRTAALFGPRGWQIGDATLVFPDGPPEGAEAAALDLPAWMVEQLPSLEFAAGGLRTDFLRLPRVVERLRAEGSDAAVFVLGRVPVAAVITGGQVLVVEPALTDGLAVEAAITAASGWVVVLAGPVRIQAPSPPVDEEAAKAAVEEAEPAAKPPEAPVRVPPGPPGPGEERFLVSPATAQSLPPEVSAEIAALVGDAGYQVVVLLDGSRTTVEIAQATGLRPEQVSAVVKTLVSHKLAFRYVSRARRPTGVQAPG